MSKENLEHLKLINWRLFIHKFCNNSKMLLSSSWAIFIRALVFSSSPKANFSLFEYLCFSFLLIFRLKKRKTEKQLYYHKDWEFLITLYYLSWYNKTQSRFFLFQLKTIMQWLWKFKQKIICDENFWEKYWKGFLLLTRFKDVLAGTFSKI